MLSYDLIISHSQISGHGPKCPFVFYINFLQEASNQSYSNDFRLSIPHSLCESISLPVH